MIKSCFYCVLFLFVQFSYAAEKSGKKFEFEWVNKGEEIYVIQDKEFPKSKRFNFELYFIDSENQPYYQTSGFGASFTYYFNENWGVDVTYKKYGSEKSNDLKSLLDDRNIKPLVRNVDNSKIINLDWVPFYGKVNLFDKIFYFDWGLGVGIGQLDMRSNENTFTQGNIPLTLKASTKTAYSFKTYFKFYAFENLNFGMQYDLTYFDAVINSRGDQQMVNINDLLLSIGYMFP